MGYGGYEVESFATESKGAGNRAASLSAAGAVQLSLVPLRAHPMAVGVQQQGAAFLHRMAVGSPTRAAEIAAAGAIETVVKAFHDSPPQEPVIATEILGARPCYCLTPLPTGNPLSLL